MTRGRKTSLTLILTPEERQTLLAWQRSTTMPAGVPDAGGLFYSWLRAWPSPTLRTGWVSTGALSTNGSRVFSTSAWRASLTARAVAPGDTRRRIPPRPYTWEREQRQDTLPTGATNYHTRREARDGLGCLVRSHKGIRKCGILFGMRKPIYIRPLTRDEHTLHEGLRSSNAFTLDSQVFSG